MLAAGLSGLAIPIDTTNPWPLSVDVVMVTGYLYVARTVLGRPLALGFGVVVGMRAERRDQVWLRRSWQQ